MITKLTTKSQEALAAALQAAAADGQPKLEPAHLLLALIEQPGGVAGALLDALGVNSEAVKQRGHALIQTLPKVSGSAVASPDASRATHAVLAKASEEATALGDEYVSTEHLLLGLAAARHVRTLPRHLRAPREPLPAALPRLRRPPPPPPP